MASGLLTRTRWLNRLRASLAGCAGNIFPRPSQLEKLLIPQGKHLAGATFQDEELLADGRGRDAVLFGRAGEALRFG